jgi:nucleotide-binding universal stress UspA family protein
MKTILVPLYWLNHSEDVLESVSLIAKKNNSTVIALYPIPLSTSYTAPIASAFSGYNPVGVIPIEDSLRSVFEDEEEKVKLNFESIMRKHNVAYEWRKIHLQSPFFSETVIEHSRSADLVVLFNDTSGTGESMDSVNFSANVVLSAGRPVLLLPAQGKQRFSFDVVTIGWDASREAARAVFDSVPILKMSEEAHLVTVNEHKTKNTPPPAPPLEALIETLSNHGVKANLYSIPNTSEVGKALLSFSDKQGSTLLVIGAYGRSRLQEQILGGTTEYILKHMKIPVLMSN